MVRKVLLTCGILASLLYVGTDILAAMRDEGYSYAAQGISELGAIGAPTRPLVVSGFTVHSMLKIAFAVGVWVSAGGRRSLRITAGLLFALGLIDLVSYAFPPHLRIDAGATFNDTMHLVLTGVASLVIFLAIGFGAGADGKWFRIYSYATIVVLLVCGVWAASDAPRIAANLPTPWFGVRERINVYGYLLWIAMLAAVLLRAERAVAPAQPGGGSVAGPVGPQPA